MIKPSELTWDDVVRVGPGTLGGNYLRCFWWPVALSEEVRDIPVPVKLLGEELVLFPISPGSWRSWEPIARTGGPRSSTAESKRKGSAALITDGTTIAKERSSTGLPSRSRQRPTSGTRGMR